MPLHQPIRSTRRTSRQQSFLALGSLLALTATPLMAAENPGAHEHGSAVLQMAVEENRIDLMFTSPAYNLAGFEHEARTDEQKARLEEVRQWLETTALVDTDSRGCRVTAASVQLGEEMEDHHDHHDDHHGHEDDHEEATHREYDVSQQLECEGMEASQELESALMDRFEDLEELTIEWVSPSGQGSARLTSSNRAFTINN
ncbi:DUF2796 domain-containing protein [Marinobacter sp. HL-58]|uniref:ZrgA family zinc uptake protein n=1 Tax=Marinobacter sp. HL-58 TaxID=1479237 RepID=UPI00048373CA|nr:DUF2796 domain-containing protein [Marinobacter sp. HL-58]KPQ02987.1 MAG: Protein of unknown function (DUF2796) [Marinobacter sp. HL-58]